MGFIHGAPMSAMIAAIYTSIPYDIGSDIATGIGISQAIVILYMHIGRAKFVHFYTFTGFDAPSIMSANASWNNGVH
eukprot:CAMPEP_0170175270 /NCGR_PEP_ID=MMETSP0040_2-20121228/8368_1 /TAXON_ID=641309 /ORGANISM="Lotharella oceanica, Strain CCMP622" /LENGTH=76 /DNA_ID=CAMNT_0010417191 /DNA_START=576 /DNA_END=806 /DNA_ORIENTATION=+